MCAIAEATYRLEQAALEARDAIEELQRLGVAVRIESTADQASGVLTIFLDTSQTPTARGLVCEG
ncbi:MAG: hypothetical protein AAFQ43_00885 [Bacteroidota bacterium]